MTAIVVSEITEITLEGQGVFDVLMRASRLHLDKEFQLGRIKGSEYSSVYLATMQASMQNALSFVLQKQKADQDAQVAKEQVLLVHQQYLNAVTENAVLLAQKCKLDAEFDLLQESKLKTASETALLTQKKVTEAAQTMAMGVDADSVLGKQKALYQAQTDGFTRDAEQKAAKLMVDSWNVRRTTDEATVADGTNMLNDTAVGRAVTKLLTGVGA